ncbi:Octanoyltransferase LipM [compost metagenome]
MPFPERPWRLLPDTVGDAAWNMALDEALLESHRLGLTPPTLRFYSWEPAALSLGYAQPLGDVNLDACQKAGIAVVRRSTGGRAVLHQGEFTYAVIASEGFPASVAGTYRMITEVLAQAIARLGVPADIAPGKLSRAGSASCFQSATQADLVALGRKLVGSAQTRRDGAFLQHGSLMLTQQPEEIRAYLHRPTEGGDATCLSNVVETMPSREAIAQGIVEAAASTWGIRLEVGMLTPWECERAQERLGAHHLG